MPSRIKKRHLVIYIFICLPVGLSIGGCSSHQIHTAKPSLSLNTTDGQSIPLDAVEELVAQKKFESAAKRLKKVNIGMTSVQDRDRLAYLTARIALAQNPNSGCALIAKYAHQTTHTQRKAEAAKLALRCLPPPKACPQIQSLSAYFLSDLKAMDAQGLLRIRLRCPDHATVADALVLQQRQFSTEDPVASSAVATLITHLDGIALKTVLPRLTQSELLQEKIRLRLLADFLPILSEAEQKQYISTLSPTHPTRIAWEGSTRGTRIVVCLPLTGKFGTVGTSIQGQLKRLKSETQLFSGDLTFMDCDTEAWSESLFNTTLQKVGAQFVLSLTDSRLLVKLSKVLEKKPGITHFTLNPIYPGTTIGKNTWTLNVAPDLRVGTFVNDALKHLKRTGSMPLPIDLLCVTDGERQSPIKRYLEQFAASFRTLEVLSIPKPCTPDTPARTCASQRQQEWMRLAAKVSKLANTSEPFEILYLDLNADQAVSFLKYFANENIDVDPSGRRRGKQSKKHSPLIYADQRPVDSAETQVEILEQGNDTPQRVLRNRFTRLSGEYSNGIRYLVHFSPLADAAAMFIENATRRLGDLPRAEVITLVEALGLIDTIVKARRQPEEQSALAKGQPITYQGHTSGLSWSHAVRTLPRLGIIITRDGYFIEQ